MLIRFWGTRGSVASPGRDTVRFGGNTSCVEVRQGDSLAILDCGTGARALGASLLGQTPGPRAHILLTHFHWDHIQGFPFFLPVFLPGAEIHVYGTGGLEQGLEEALSGQMQYTYFPVRLSELSSRIAFHEIGESTFAAGQFTIQTQHLNHTCPTLGYRLTAAGRTVAYVTDHEPFWPHNPDLPLEDTLVHPGDLRHAAFVEGVDLLIHDAQYTAAEYPAKRGWGHSTIEYVVDLAVAAHVARLALFHHDPPRHDDALDALVERARARARERGSDLQVFAASEGDSVELADREATTIATHSARQTPNPATTRILVLGPPELRRSLREALVEESYRLMEADTGLPSDFPDGLPDVVIVASPDGADVMADVRAARRVATDRPLIALVGEVDDEQLREVSELSADVVVRPFGPPNLRARVRACLGRVEPRQNEDRWFPLPESEAPHMVDRLSTPELEALLREGAQCVYEPGEVLFRQGDQPRGVYYIHEGMLRLSVTGHDGVDVIVGFAGPGDTVGEMSALDGQPRSATGHVLRRLDARYITRDVFRKALERSPETSSRLLRLLARRLREADQRMAGLPRGASPALALAGATEILSAEHDPVALRDRVQRLERLVAQLEVSEQQLEGLAQDESVATPKLREWKHALAALRHVSRLLTSPPAGPDFPRAALATLGELIPSEAIGFFVRREGRLVRVAASGRVPARWPEAGNAAPVADGAANQPSARRREPPVTIAFPLEAADSVVGGLLLRRESPLSDDERSLLELVAAACTLALKQRLMAQSRPGAHDLALADLEATLELEVARARRLHYPIGIVVGRLNGNGSKSAASHRPLSAEQLAITLRGALRRTDVLTAGRAVDVGIILPGLAADSLPSVEARVQAALDRHFNKRRSKSDQDTIRIHGLVAQPNSIEARDLLREAMAGLGVNSSA